ncbi:MAG: Gfo/Idh/MocA family oxidoreductase [Chloroflexi bacterium]|nr:Gfo/Idh/MocA family oxidoreductase [Chloroflexota bacterium]MCL5108681.1 Gfo/Idh/MocA family oxidoreductase [Chloroflexota bacterium]
MRTIRTAIIGAGAVVEMYLEQGLLSLRDAGEVEFVTAYSRTPEKAAALAARTGAEPCTDLDAALANPALEAVIIATPHASHAPICLAALSAGKHVLVEKPIAERLDDARAMVLAARQAGLTLAVFENFRFAEPFLKARQCVEAGDIGDLVGVLGQRFVYLAGAWTTSNWRAQLDGGGIVIDQLCHYVAALRLIVGQKITQVSALTSRCRSDFAAEDTLAVNLRFDSGLMGQIFLSWASRADLEPEVRVYGTDGSLDVYRWPDGRVTLRGANLPDGPRVLVPRSDFLCHPQTFREFFTAVRERREPVSSGLEGWRDLAVVEAARRSALGGRLEPVEDFAPSGDGAR